MRKRVILVTILALIVIVGGVGIGLAWKTNRFDKWLPPNIKEMFGRGEKPEEESEEEPEERISFTKDKIFLVEEGNIFMMDKLGENKVQITNYPKTDPTWPPKLPQVIDDEYLGYYKCDVKVGDFNCGVYRVSVISGQPEKLLREEKDNLIEQLAWYDKDTFAYTTDSLGIYLYKNGSKSTVKEITCLKDVEQDLAPFIGAGIETSVKLAFSPDGTKILHLSSITPCLGAFVVYVYDLGGNELAKIENATQPDWIDDERIIFRQVGYQGLEEGLYSFNISSKERKEWGTDKEAYHPRVLKGSQKVAYWVREENGQVWLMDLATGKNEKLLDNASHPLWVSQEEVLVASDRKSCEEAEDPLDCSRSGTGSFATSLSILNTSTREVSNIENASGQYYYFVALSDESQVYSVGVGW